MTAEGLNAAILAAHARDDRAALVDLYSQAADQAADVDAKCFFWTYAYVFALELDHQAGPSLFQKLKSNGRV